MSPLYNKWGQMVWGQQQGVEVWHSGRVLSLAQQRTTQTTACQLACQKRFASARMTARSKAAACSLRCCHSGSKQCPLEGTPDQQAPGWVEDTHLGRGAACWTPASDTAHRVVWTTTDLGRDTPPPSAASEPPESNMSSVVGFSLKTSLQAAPHVWISALACLHLPLEGSICFWTCLAGEPAGSTTTLSRQPGRCGSQLATGMESSRQGAPSVTKDFPVCQRLLAAAAHMAMHGQLK